MAVWTRIRAVDFLRASAEKLAPLWLPHYGVKLPPEEVTDAFDRAVAQIMVKEPTLLEVFGYTYSDRHKLQSDLLDIIIDEGHRAVHELQAREREVQRYGEEVRALSPEERLEFLRKKRDEQVAEENAAAAAKAEEELRLEEERQAREAKSQQRRERIAYLRAKLTAKAEAESAEAKAKAEAEAAEARARAAAEAAAIREAEIARARDSVKQQLAHFDQVSASWPDARGFKRGVKAVATLIADACGEVKPAELLNNMSGFFTDSTKPYLQPAVYSREIEVAAQDMLGASGLVSSSTRELDEYKEVLANTFTRFFSLLSKELKLSKLPLQLRTICLAVIQEFSMRLGTVGGGPLSASLRGAGRENWASETQNKIFGAYWDRNFEFTLSPVKKLEPFPNAIVVKTIVDEISAAMGERARKRAEDQARIVEARKNLGKWQELYPHPGGQPYGVSHLGAEFWVKDWCLHMGLEDAAVTQQSGDGGIDVVSSTHIIQVKHYTGTVGIASIRELIGVAAVDGRKAAFFTSGTYPASARQLADQANLALFLYDVISGKVQASSAEAERIMQNGLLRLNTDTNSR